MPKNVEIKARVGSIKRIKQLAERICSAEAEVLQQHDTFYRVPIGRLKLRSFESEALSQLIFYNRPDSLGPKLSDYSICLVPNPEALHAVLASSLGVLGVVKKIRYLYLHDQTRIHIDDVEGLGHFVELEVVLKPNQTQQEGETIAQKLMTTLEIGEEDLLTGAYLDQLTA